MEQLLFVSFESTGDQFIGFLSVEAALTVADDPESLLHKAATVYGRSVCRMRAIVAEIESTRARRRPIPARMVWHLGDLIFRLRAELASLSLQVDDLYGHLVRDIGVPRKRLEKIVILRRYIPKKALVPADLNWGRCEKGTRTVAERLSKGLPLR